jgi:ABC-type transporter Mla subunit MlaD
MVHRPTDSRLLANLLSQEKEYSKQLGIVLETSQASLASFSAYASASPPPISQVILSVAGALAGADEALQKYWQAVDEWRDQLMRLKELESEVGNIMRDREIL